MLTSAEIQLIKQKHPLAELVSQYVELRYIAGELHGGCPLDCQGGDDRFIVWEEENRYYCRQCQSKGDQFDFLEQRLGLSFHQAVEHLGEGGDNSIPSPPVLLKPSKPPTPDPFDEVSIQERQALIQNWQEELDAGDGDSDTWKVYWPDESIEPLSALSYLHAMRLLEPEAILKYQLGFNNERFELCGRSVPPGISIPLTSGQDIVGIKIRTYPARDADGELLPQDKQPPKYWRIGKGSYCLNKDSLKQHRQVIVTEGELDCILLDQIVGDRFAVITFGGTSDIAKADLPLLLFNAQSVAWAFDGDDAGYTAAKKYDGANKRYRKLVMPEGEDITSLFLKLGKDNFPDWFEDAMQGGAG